MAEPEKLEQAKAVYTELCNFFDGRKWKCRKDDGQMKLGGDVNGDTETYSFYFQVSPESALVRLILFMPFDVPQEKSTEYAAVITALNSLLAAGCFALDAQRELAFFRISNSFCDSRIDTEVYLRMLMSALGTVDTLAVKLAAFVAGKLGMEELLTALSALEEG